MKEIWNIIHGYSDYQISNYGRVKSLKFNRELILKPIISDGYRTVGLDGVFPVKIGRLVLLTFIGPCPEGMEVSHLNGNKLDDRLRSLIWETHWDNMQRRIPSEIPPNFKGDKNPMAKLKNEDIIKIRKLLRMQKYTQEDIAYKFNVQPMNISRIKRNKRWKHIQLKGE